MEVDIYGAREGCCCSTCRKIRERAIEKKIVGSNVDSQKSKGPVQVKGEPMSICRAYLIKTDPTTGKQTEVKDLGVIINNAGSDQPAIAKAMQMEGVAEEIAKENGSRVWLEYPAIR